MTKDEALKLALEALEVATTPLAKDRQEVLRARAAIREALAQPEHDWKAEYIKQVELHNQTLDELREALAQPEQEPVAHTTGHCENHKQKGGCQLHNLQCGWPDCDRKPCGVQAMTCHDCERHKLSASMWRNEAYKHAGTPLPWKPEELLREEYERGFIDGMQKQMQSSVDKVVNGMTRQWVGLTQEDINIAFDDTQEGGGFDEFAHAIEAKLKEKNT